MFSSPIEPEIAYALMLCGAFFALAGIWLILRPRVEGTTAKLELFGLKFESSSAGVLVFLIGAAFLAVPLFAEIAREAAPADKPPSEPGKVPTDPAPPAQTPSTQPPRAFTAIGQEVEENNNFAEANEIEIGALITGTLTQGDPDYFSFAVPDDFVGTISVNLLGPTWFTVYDDLGDKISSAHEGYSGRAEYPRYYVRLSTDERQQPYTLTIAARPD